MIEITSYVLGMLTIGVALMLITLIAGIVKINKLEKQNNHHEKQFEQVYDNMHRYDHELRHLLEATNRDINMVEKTIMNQIEKIDRDHHSIEDNIHREINQTKSYIDSRIDKLRTEQGSKQILKG